MSSPNGKSQGLNPTKVLEKYGGSENDTTDEEMLLGCYGDTSNQYNSLAHFTSLDKVIYSGIQGFRASPIDDNMKDGVNLRRKMSPLVKRAYQGYLPEYRLKQGPLLERLAKDIEVFDRTQHGKQDTLAHFLSSYRHLRSKRRYFQGNINYYNMFNKEVKDFYEFRRSYNEIEMKQGSIGIDGSLRYSTHKRDDDPLQRTRWDQEEKEIFFGALARYSIHRLDEIKKHLPKKSCVQILDYYHLLKKTLRRYKRDPKKIQSLVAMSEIPIAYEMSDEFIEFEESQASLMISPCNKRVQSKVSSSKKIAAMHIFRPHQDLIDWDKLAKIAEAFEDKKRSADNPDVNIPDSVQILIKDLIVDLIYRTLLKITERKICELSVSKLKETRRMSIDITREEINTAFGKLTTRNFNIEEFWSEYFHEPPNKKRRVESVDPEDVYNSQEIERHADLQNSVEIEQKQPPPSFDFNTAVRNTRPIEVLNYVVPEMHTYPEDLQAQNIDPLLWKEIDEANEVPALAEDEETTEDVEISEKLMLMESALLERLDHEASVKYESIVLGYMQAHPDLIDMNHRDLCSYYILSKYYPKDLPFYYHDDLSFVKEEQRLIQEREEENAKEAVATAVLERAEALNACQKNKKRLKKRLNQSSTNANVHQLDKLRNQLKEQESVMETLKKSRDLMPIYDNTGKSELIKIALLYGDGKVTYAYYNENDPYEMPMFDEITDEMLLLHNYQFSEY
ncbi:hypothetical protein FOA43_002186 [Brettanomyces nanus]|uniref:Myb-like domain-containing protein n=1 Tax=Eeniella nana TaxID=13502 RepID=A0A875RPB8_EENNA|nr:uncharacterized protein FOA43_002186 [Brettanomyces nanus]QPG74850.1 hypothetical protein FOA43_002186 [Brettanomyces nanus]